MARAACPHCQAQFQARDDKIGKAATCPVCHRPFVVEIQPPPVPPPDANSQHSEPIDAEVVDDDSLYRDDFVTVRMDGTAEFRVHSASEAKLAIKSVKLLKRQLRVHLKELDLQLRSVRHQYTDRVRRRGSMLRGGGKIGEIIRLIQTVTRDSARRELAGNIDPLFNKKQYIDHLITSLDQHLVRLEGFRIKRGTRVDIDVKFKSV